MSTQLIQAVLILSIPVAAYFDRLSVGLILVTIPLLSFLNQFVYPFQNAALPRIVAESQLTRANSAFSFANQGTNTTRIEHLTPIQRLPISLFHSDHASQPIYTRCGLIFQYL